MVTRARALTKSYPTSSGSAVEILHGIDLEIRPGETVAIVGPSGSGKSTLLHCLSGIERPTTGTVDIAGVDVGGASAKTLAKLRRGTVGFVFQQYNLIDSLTAHDNVALQVRLARRPKERAAEALGAVGLAEHAAKKPAFLSGGQQQRVAIARALAVRPDVLFADEPTGALDSTTGARVLELLQYQARSHGTAVVLVTHDLEAASRADRVLVLKDGLIHGELAEASPTELLREFERIAALPAAAASPTGTVS